MPLPVIPNMFRITLRFTNPNAPRPASCHLHVLGAEASPTVDEVYSNFDGNVSADLWLGITDQATIDQVTVIPLDGETSGKTFATGGAAKWKGSGGTDCILQAAIGVTLRSLRRGPRGRNRIYLPWVGETNQLNGVLTGSAPATMQTAWNALVVAQAADLYPLAAVSALHTDFNLVTSTTVRTNIRTQRRRARH